MPRHDIYRSPDGRGYLLDVQADWIEGLDTRIVVPMLPVEDAPQVARILNPVVEIEGRDHMMATQYASAIQGRLLRAPVASLRPRADEVTRALDLLLHGF